MILNDDVKNSLLKLYTPKEIEIIEEKLTSIAAEKKWPENSLQQFLNQVLRIPNIPISDVYEFIISPKTTLAHLNTLLAAESDEIFNDIFLHYSYTISTNNFNTTFKKSGFLDKLSSITPAGQQLKVISINCGLAVEAYAILKARPDSYYTGFDVNKNTLGLATTLHTSLYGSKWLNDRLQLSNIDVQNLLNLSAFKNKKYDVIVLRNLTLMNASPDNPFVRILSDVVPKLAGKNTILYLSCYHKKELITAMELLNIKTDNIISDEEVMPQNDAFYICQPYSPPANQIASTSLSANPEEMRNNRFFAMNRSINTVIFSREWLKKNPTNPDPARGHYVFCNFKYNNSGQIIDINFNFNDLATRNCPVGAAPAILRESSLDGAIVLDYLVKPENFSDALKEVRENLVKNFVEWLVSKGMLRVDAEKSADTVFSDVNNVDNINDINKSLIGYCCKSLRFWLTERGWVREMDKPQDVIPVNKDSAQKFISQFFTEMIEGTEDLKKIWIITPDSVQKTSNTAYANFGYIKSFTDEKSDDEQPDDELASSQSSNAYSPFSG